MTAAQLEVLMYLWECDVLAIISAMGFDKALMFGQSGGGIIALELAASRPEVIDFLVVYEAPVTEVLPEPEAAKWRSFYQQVFALALYHTNPGMSNKEQRAGLSNKVLS